MSDERGLYEKFNVTRHDGKSEPGGAHENCSYFVLDLNHDRFAWPALDAYATYCEEERPELAKDLRRMVDPNLAALGIKPIADELSRLTAAEQECERLRADLKEALDEWGYSSGYKGEYLQEKHNDLELIREIRERHFGSAARTGGGEGKE